MGKMKELLDNRLEEHKYDMYELLKRLKDINDLEEMGKILHATNLLIHTIESLGEDK